MFQFNSKDLKKIGVFTSGGDAPGMNAAIRSVVRSGLCSGLEVDGIIGGYKGILKKEFVPLNMRSVANTIQRGGTLLKTGRCPEFHKPEERANAAQALRDQGIQALVCIGGDGSFTGAQLLWNEQKIPFIGVPGTIDNDLAGTDYTIGFDTAVNTALEAIDRIRDTAASHDRLFIVEVMGRNSGYIAIEVGIAGGAEGIFIPEVTYSIDQVVQKIKNSVSSGKTSSILVAAEGQKPGRAYDLAESIRKKSGFEAKVCVLGHIQRGGAPSARDRILGSRMGAAAISLLIQGKTNYMIGIVGTQLHEVEIPKALTIKKDLPSGLKELVHTLSH